MLSPKAILLALQQQAPIKLASLPDEHGVYALIDHTGLIRYVGVTESSAMGFRRRIYQYHVTGSEGRSHKFSQAYNTGRMWRSRSANNQQAPAYAKLAKSLRTTFCRTFCKAAYFSVTRDECPENFFGFLTHLEREVQRLAPTSMRQWEGIHFPSVPEPVALVDRLIESLNLSQAEREALDVQAALCGAG